MNDKGTYQFGHQFKTKARTYKKIADDISDVLKEHEQLLMSDVKSLHLRNRILDVISDAESAYIAEDDKYNDNV